MCRVAILFLVLAFACAIGAFDTVLVDFENVPSGRMARKKALKLSRRSLVLVEDRAAHVRERQLRSLAYDGLGICSWHAGA